MCVFECSFCQIAWQAPRLPWLVTELFSLNQLGPPASLQSSHCRHMVSPPLWKVPFSPTQPGIQYRDTVMHTLHWSRVQYLGWININNTDSKKIKQFLLLFNQVSLTRIYRIIQCFLHWRSTHGSSLKSFWKVLDPYVVLSVSLPTEAVSWSSRRNQTCSECVAGNHTHCPMVADECQSQVKGQWKWLIVNKVKFCL